MTATGPTVPDPWPCPTIRAIDGAVGEPLPLTTPPGFTIEDPAERLLVEQMTALRPGLRPEQACAALQALRTLPYTLHPAAQPCTAAPTDPAPGCCPATTSGPWAATLCCTLSPQHTGPWHDSGGNTTWRVDETGTLNLVIDDTCRHDR
ncbi:hypothetical protein ACIGZJ_30785 [Kitasatospora sp. NPDC052868]|uniref:hypothetical protein n=1 Tax=Kitasatospora sp. NPDC052868 TaxID=3364060 RepID=UPI0037CA7902